MTLSCWLLLEVLSPWDFFLLLCIEPQTPYEPVALSRREEAGTVPQEPYVPPKFCSPQQGSRIHQFALRTAEVHHKSQ